MQGMVQTRNITETEANTDAAIFRLTQDEEELLKCQRNMFDIITRMGNDHKSTLRKIVQLQLEVIRIKKELQKLQNSTDSGNNHPANEQHTTLSSVDDRFDNSELSLSNIFKRFRSLDSLVNFAETCISIIAAKENRSYPLTRNEIYSQFDKQMGKPKMEAERCTELLGTRLKKILSVDEFQPILLTILINRLK